MSVEDELRAAARNYKEQLEAARSREADARARFEAAQRAALERADARGAELDEAVKVFLKLMRQAGNPGLARVWTNKRTEGWRVLKTQKFDVTATWILWNTGEWELVNGGPRGSSRHVLRELVGQRFRGIGPYGSWSPGAHHEPIVVDEDADMLKNALARTMAENGVA